MTDSQEVKCFEFSGAPRGGGGHFFGA